MVDVKGTLGRIYRLVLCSIRFVLFAAGILCGLAILVITTAGIFMGIILVTQPDYVCIGLVIGFVILMCGYDRLDAKMRTKT